MVDKIQFVLNGKSVQITAEKDHSLLWLLRKDFGLTGAKYGCGEGLCGACTVLIDREAVPACQVAVGNSIGP
jgi:aerobic-type carbon monoxide dehydrogenase small subunit (CoxS/CutS family)